MALTVPKGADMPSGDQGFDSGRDASARDPAGRRGNECHGLTDRRTIALERGHLDVAARLELAHDRCRGPHPCRDDRLGEGPLLANRGQATRKPPTRFRLGDELRKVRVLPGALRDDLGDEVLGHAVEYASSKP